MSRRRVGFLIAALAVVPSTARAGDLAVNVGAIEVVGVPDPTHLGFYPYVAVSLALPQDRVVLIPNLGIEYSPDQSRWGFVGGLVVDIPLRDRIAFDAAVTAIHDQSGGEFGDALFFLGVGAGMSFSVSPVVISPSLNVFRALNADGWSLVPGINVAYAL